MAMQLSHKSQKKRCTHTHADCNRHKRNSKWRCSNFLSLSQPVSHFLSHLITLTFRQQSILNDSRLEQQSRQQQAERNEYVHERRCRSSMCPQRAQCATSCLLLKAIVRCQRAASLLGASCQLDAIVSQVSHLSSIQILKIAISFQAMHRGMYIIEYIPPKWGKIYRN